MSMVGKEGLYSSAPWLQMLSGCNPANESESLCLGEFNLTSSILHKTSLNCQPSPPVDKGGGEEDKKPLGDAIARPLPHTCAMCGHPALKQNSGLDWKVKVAIRLIHSSYWSIKW